MTATLRAKQAEKNEKAIRELMKLEANKTCFDCKEKRPMYLCLELGTFVCTNCAGIHRSQLRRVKGVGMAEFTEEEVEHAKQMGNEGAEKVWLATWNPAQFEKPDPTERIKVEKFMKMKYDEKRFFKPLVKDSKKESKKSKNDLFEQEQLPKEEPKKKTTKAKVDQIVKEQVVEAAPIQTAPVQQTIITPPQQAEQESKPVAEASPEADLLFNGTSSNSFFQLGGPNSNTNQSQTSSASTANNTAQGIMSLFGNTNAPPISNPGQFIPPPYNQYPQQPNINQWPNQQVQWGQQVQNIPMQANNWGVQPQPQQPPAPTWGVQQTVSNPWNNQNWGQTVQAPPVTIPQNPWNQQIPSQQNPWGVTAPNPASTQMQPSSASNPWNTSAPTQQIQSNPWGAPTQATTAQNVWGAPSAGNDTTNKPFNPFD